MGAGNLMSTSIHKSVNAIAKLQLAVHYASIDHNFKGKTLVINDGVYLVSRDKNETMNMLQTTISTLVGNFIDRRKHWDRFLVRAAIAFGPVYFGNDFSKTLKRFSHDNDAEEAIAQIMIGAPIINAYEAEKSAPVYGIAIHESARAFAPDGQLPFRTRFWPWWLASDKKNSDRDTLKPLKEVFFKDLEKYLFFMKSTAIFHGVKADKIDEWLSCAEQYYVGDKAT